MLHDDLAALMCLEERTKNLRSSGAPSGRTEGSRVTTAPASAHLRERRLLPENDLYIGDCLELLDNLADHSVDFTLTDPAYFLDKLDNHWDRTVVHGTRHQGTVKSLPPNMRFDPEHGHRLYRFYLEVSRKLFRVMKPGAYFISFAAPRLYHRTACAVEDAGFLVRDQFLWLYPQNQVKAQGMQNFLKKAKWLTDEQKGQLVMDLAGWKTPQIRSNHEPMCVAQKPLEGTFVKNWHDHKVGLMNCNLRVGDDKFPSNVMFTGPFETDGDEFLAAIARHFLIGKPSREEKGEYNDHKTVKPLEMCLHLIALTTPPGALVLDPFVGSGTTCAAAILLGRRFYGFDLEADYVKIAKRRVADAEKQRDKLLDDLQIWIEDTEDLGARQRNVRCLWEDFSRLPLEYLDSYLALLPESHRQMWRKLRKP